MLLSVILVLICGAAVAISYVCYRMAFHVSHKDRAENEAKTLPDGEEYEPYRPRMEKWVQELLQMPCESFEIESFDGLKLRAKFYEFAPGAPVELMFHGYRGTAVRDLSGGVSRCFSLGHSSLLIDQRGSGRSEGDTISFGINEHKDCLRWAEFAAEHFGPDVKIILTGISMGAATVLMASDKDLPPNVIGILADCGFSSAKGIVSKVIKEMGFPVCIAYPFVKLGARLFGGFKLEAGSPLESVKNSRLPIIFFHGEADYFVPCDMSRELYENCASKKRIVTVPGAAHGLSYPAAPEKYLSSMREFFPV